MSHISSALSGMTSGRAQGRNHGIPYTDNMHRKIKEENDKLREREREIESKNIAETEKAAMKELSEKEYEESMALLAELVEHTLKLSAEEHAKELDSAIKGAYLFGRQSRI